ncbi:hypothetical protein ACWF95_40610 [Streptomyces vinaceus]
MIDLLKGIAVLEVARERVHDLSAHSACWANVGPPLGEGIRAATARERWRQALGLLENGAGLLECSWRLGLSRNTAKRYARHGEPKHLVRTPQYRPRIDPDRDHLRQRRQEHPSVPVTHRLHETKELG